MPPEHGYTTKVMVHKNHDGDTVTVKFEREFDIRIRDINAPEINTEEGIASRDYLNFLLRQNPYEVTIFVPTSNDAKLMDINSFNRIVADLWVENKNIGDEMVRAGHATYVGKDHHKVVKDRNET